MNILSHWDTLSVIIFQPLPDYIFALKLVLWKMNQYAVVGMFHQLCRRQGLGHSGEGLSR